MESQGTHLSTEIVPISEANWLTYRPQVRLLEDVFGKVAATDEQLDAAMLDPDNIRVVVVDTDRPDYAVAYSYAEPLRAAFHLDGPKQERALAPYTLYLNTCSVAPEYSGRGLSRQLRDYRMGLGMELGYSRFTMHVKTTLLAKPSSIWPHQIRPIRELPRWRGMLDSWSYVELYPAVIV